MLRPDTKHREYQKFAAQWQRARDTFAGSDAVKLRRELYLPKLDVHLRGTKGDERYNAYLRRAYFYNAVRRTVVGLSGLVHQKAPEVKAPEGADAWLDNVTMTGVSAQLQALLTTQEVILVGRQGILVEMTGGEVPRPYWVPLAAENVVNWQVGYRDGEPYLSLVVFRECVYESDPENIFETKEVEQYRVLSLVDGMYAQTVWKQDTKSGAWVVGEPIVPQRRGKPLTFIPFIFAGPTSTAPSVEAPPLIDLVDLNISHYQTTANLEHGLGYLGAPSLVIIGAATKTAEGKPIEYGSSSALTLPAGADAKILQADGNLMGALEHAEERKRNLLATLGARLLEDAPTTSETATAVAMRHSGEHATLRTIAQSVENAFKSALQISLWWQTVAAEPGDVDANFELNKDFFATKMSAEELKALVLALQADGISFETFWAALTAGGIARPGVTAEQELEEIHTQSGPSKMPNAPTAPQKGAVEGNPYELKRLGGEWVVTKLGTDEVVPGGRHGQDHEKALRHLRALEAAYSKENK